MAAEPKLDRSMPFLTVAQVSRVFRDENGELVNRFEWAVVSNEDQTPLTEEQARGILAAYLTVRHLMDR